MDSNSHYSETPLSAGQTMVAGDLVHSDQITGDKVGGDKITVVTGPAPVSRLPVSACLFVEFCFGRK